MRARAVPPVERRSIEAAGETAVRIEVPAGHWISGRIVDEAGAPLPSAHLTVRAPAWTGHVSDRSSTVVSDGSFRVGPFAGRVRLNAFAPGRVARHVVEVDLTHESVEGVLLELVRSATLRVEVRGEAGSIEGASVKVRRAEPWIERRPLEQFGPEEFLGTTDADGAFEREVAPGELDVRVAAEHHFPWEGTHDPESGPLLVRLESGAALLGIVRDVAGAPIAGARVRCFAEGPVDIEDQTTESDGRFRFGGLSTTEDAVLIVKAEGYRVFEREGPLGGGENTWDVALEACAPITGLVRDVDLAPARGALVTLFDAARGPDAWLEQESTDEEGRFRFPTLPPGERFSLVARADSWDTPWIRSEVREAGPGDDVMLDLDATAFRGVAFSGTVRDAVTLEPLEPFDVTYFVENSGTGHEYVGGRFERAGYPADRRVRLVIEAPDHVPEEFPLRLYPPGDHRFDVLLLPCREVAFRITTPDGHATPDAVLSVRTREGRGLSQPLGLGLSVGWLEADHDGRVVARQVPAAACMVAVAPFKSGPERAIPLDFTVAPSGEVDVVVEAVEFLERTVLAHGVAATEADPAASVAAGRSWPLEAPLRVAVERDVAAPGEPAAWRVVSQHGDRPGPRVSLRLPSVGLRVRVECEGYEPTAVDVPRPDAVEEIVVVLARRGGP